jgi:hypothetical protein
MKEADPEVIVTGNVICSARIVTRELYYTCTISTRLFIILIVFITSVNYLLGAPSTLSASSGSTQPSVRPSHFNVHINSFNLSIGAVALLPALKPDSVFQRISFRAVPLTKELLAHKTHEFCSPGFFYQYQS